MWGANMKEEKSKEYIEEFFNEISGFTARLEREISEREKSKEKVTLDRVTSMPTYHFATLALENESPLQVVKVMQTLRKRYSSKKNIDKETLGFLDDIEGKAYGYIALNINNIEQKYKFYKAACKCFKNGISRGYYDAALDLADLQAKMEDIRVGERTALDVFFKTDKAASKLGELFYGFDKLVESAIRVIENKRPLIENENDFYYALRKYEKRKETSINCRLYYGLALIINNEGNDKEEGLKLVKETFAAFKKENSQLNKVMFKSDVDKFNKTLQILENKLIQINSR